MLTKMCDSSACMLMPFDSFKHACVERVHVQRHPLSAVHFLLSTACSPLPAVQDRGSFVVSSAQFQKVFLCKGMKSRAGSLKKSWMILCVYVRSQSCSLNINNHLCSEIK